jgi:hypothetical protein
MSETYRRMARRVAAALLMGGLLCATGCTSVIYDSNPEGPTVTLDADPDFASATVQNLMATSVGWALENYPPPTGATGSSGDDGWIAINLPRGLTREQYIGVAGRIGERVAPITPEVEDLPTYHVGWVWMRGDKARVDVFRPVYSLSRGGEVVNQAITLHLHRRFSSWRVERTQPWSPGVVGLPPVYYFPEEEVEEEAIEPESAGQEG